GTVVPGSSVSMLVLRDGRKEDFSVKIETLPADLAALAAGGAGGATQHSPQQVHSQGLTLQQLDADERKRLGLGDNGVRVAALEAGAGAEAGLRVGDVILAVGKHWVDSPATFTALVKDHDGPLALLVWRDGDRLYLALRAQ